jgi:divalent metal cation (Fe/Co/Zn/Cd) transporter
MLTYFREKKSWSRKEADIEHMFGHERAQNAAALVAATLFIFVTSFSLLREAVPELFQPQESAFQRPGMALAVIGGAMVLQDVPIVRLFLQKERIAAGKATLLEGVNDQLSTVAALVGRSPGEDFMNTVRETAYSVSGVNAIGGRRSRAKDPGPNLSTPKMCTG